MNEPFDVQKTIHDRIVMHSKHGVQGAWSEPYRLQAFRSAQSRTKGDGP